MSLSCDGCPTRILAPKGHPELLSGIALAAGWILAWPRSRDRRQFQDLCPACVGRARVPETGSPVHVPIPGVYDLSEWR